MPNTFRLDQSSEIGPIFCIRKNMALVIAKGLVGGKSMALVTTKGLVGGKSMASVTTEGAVFQKSRASAFAERAGNTMKDEG